MARQIGTLVAVILALIIAGAIYLFQTSHPVASVIVDGQVFTMEIASTDAARQKGLSGHAPLQANHGMLFVFPQPGNYGFWMKGMTFPIDIVWANGQYQITHIEQSITPSTYPTIFYPDANSVYVLEMPAGAAATNNVRVGDTIQISGSL